MTSQIDDTQPPFGTPTTAGVRANFTVAKQEITALQTATGGGPFLPLSGGHMTGPMYLQNDPTDVMMPATKGYVDASAGSGGSGGIPEAPADATTYGRSSGMWKPVVPLTGATLTGPLILADDANAPLEAATKQMVDAVSAAAAAAVPLAGGAMTGALQLSADPGAASPALQAATKRYVDSAAPMPNVCINPAFMFDQINEGNAYLMTNGGATFVCDGWLVDFQSGSGGAVNAQRILDAPPTFAYSVKTTVTTRATAVTSNDYFALSTRVEWSDIIDWALGKSAAANVSISFWAKSSIPNYIASISLANNAQSRCYVTNFTVTAANTWEFKTVTIPLDQTGTWSVAGTAVGLYVRFGLAVGSGGQITPPNAWVATSVKYGTASNSNTLLTTSNATFQIAGVKIEKSPSPTPFVLMPMWQGFQQVLRYLEKSYPPGMPLATPLPTNSHNLQFGGYENGPYGVGYPCSFKATKRLAPVITVFDFNGSTTVISYTSGGPWVAGYSNFVLAQPGPTPIGFMMIAGANTNGPIIFGFEFVADARL